MARAKAKPKPKGPSVGELGLALERIGVFLRELRGTLPSQVQDECDAVIAAIDALPMQHVDRAVKRI